VYGISVDSTWAHDAWRHQLGLPDDLVLLSDFNRAFGTAYGLLNTSATGLKDILRRAVFVIAPDGKIAYIDRQVNASTSGETVVAKLKELGVPESKSQ
jgi:peroxiredoxin